MLWFVSLFKLDKDKCLILLFWVNMIKFLFFFILFKINWVIIIFLWVLVIFFVVDGGSKVIKGIFLFLFCIVEWLEIEGILFIFRGYVLLVWVNNIKVLLVVILIILVVKLLLFFIVIWDFWLILCFLNFLVGSCLIYFWWLNFIIIFFVGGGVVFKVKICDLIFVFFDCLILFLVCLFVFLLFVFKLIFCWEIDVKLYEFFDFIFLIIWVCLGLLYLCFRVCNFFLRVLRSWCRLFNKFFNFCILVISCFNLFFNFCFFKFVSFCIGIVRRVLVWFLFKFKFFWKLILVVLLFGVFLRILIIVFNCVKVVSKFVIIWYLVWVIFNLWV